MKTRGARSAAMPGMALLLLGCSFLAAFGQQSTKSDDKAASSNSRGYVALLTPWPYRAPGNEKQIPHPAKNAGIRDDSLNLGSDAARKSEGSGYAGNEACAGCHAEIYKSYAKTAMARASGPAAEELIPGDFRHGASGAHFRVYMEGGEAWLSFERRGDAQVQGTRKLLYYIGSGHRGRTYIFSVDGFLFESPINWYAQKKIWDMAPAYQSAKEIPMTLPATPACLGCHTSNSQAPEPGTENKYKMPLFAHGGITCERCHGPGEEHARAKGRIVNPAKLSATRRDDVCMQCHLEGNVAIEQPRKHIYQFPPGEDLTDYVHYFVFADDGSKSIRALCQSEALAQSVCKRKSGDAMSCTSCHDPHSSPTVEEKVAFYRGKCLACHGEAFAAKHHANKPDCRQCHMPSIASEDVAHTQATDHRILRVPAMPLQRVEASSATPRLVRFPPVAGIEDTRDLALAWASLAEGGSAPAVTEAESRLRKANVEHPDDPAILTALGFIEQRRGNLTEARKYYKHALEMDAYSNEAASNLGVIEAQAGRMDSAVSLWKQAFERAPGKSAIGMNLAQVFCAAGKFEEARSFTRRVLEFNPDLKAAKELSRALSEDPPKCGAR